MTWYFRNSDSSLIEGNCAIYDAMWITKIYISVYFTVPEISVQPVYYEATNDTGSDQTDCMEVQTTISLDEERILESETESQIGQLHAYRYSTTHVDLRTSTSIGALSPAEGSYVCISTNDLTQNEVDITLTIERKSLFS